VEAKPEAPKMEAPRPGPTALDPAEVKRARIDGLIRRAKTELSQKRFDEATEHVNENETLFSNI
jgi:hypothetical protein